jgi:double-stranded uracil-DNA glycosylase
MDVLPDVLRPGLKVVFCGSAAGDVSAMRGAYYAGRGNKFWPTLHAIGLTPRRLRPEEFREVLAFDIGLTDVTKDQHGKDATIVRKPADAEALAKKIAHVRPGLIAFNSKAAAMAALAVKTIDYGPQGQFAGVPAFVLPSTSGSANARWNIDWWRALARLVTTP